MALRFAGGDFPSPEIYESRVILNEAAPGKARGPVVS
jgi:hypothetical protein